MSLSIPPEKVTEILDYVGRCGKARYLHKKQLQSLIGKLMHLARRVEPARVFMARLLDALRSISHAWYVKVTGSMRADLVWFEQFARTWNGRSLIPIGPPSRYIQVDACLTGIGATEGATAYAARVALDDDPVNNITEIEAAYIIIALHTFISERDAGTCIVIHCDNMAAVQAITHGRAHNQVLTECARAAWMVEALFNVKLLFEHLPGASNIVAGALSRAHTTRAYHALAAEFICNHNLSIVSPCSLFSTHPFNPDPEYNWLAGRAEDQTSLWSDTWPPSRTATRWT